MLRKITNWLLLVLLVVGTTGRSAQGYAGRGVSTPGPLALPGVDPHIVSTSPANGATGVSAQDVMTITFSEPMMTGTVSYTLTPELESWLWCNEVWDETETTLLLDPVPYLSDNQTYTVTVSGLDEMSPWRMVPPDRM